MFSGFRVLGCRVQGVAFRGLGLLEIRFRGLASRAQVSSMQASGG